MYWLDRLTRDYESTLANTFLAYGNIDDLQVIEDKHIMSFNKFLENFFTGTRKYVAEYDIATGWRFNTKEAMAAAARIVEAHKDNYIFKYQEEEEEDNRYARAPVASAPDIDIKKFKPPVEAFKLIKMICENSSGWAIYIKGIETFLQTKDWGVNREADIVCIALESLIGSDRFQDSGNIVMMTAQDINNLHPFLKSFQSRIDKIKIPQPDFNIRKRFIELCLEEGEKVEENEEEGTTDAEHVEVAFPEPQTLAGLTAGLTLRMIYECILLCQHEGEYVEKYFWDKKKEFIAVHFGEIIEVKNPKQGFEIIGGMSAVKEFFQKDIIMPMHSGNTQRVPMGVLMTGPPGTGKSIMAEAVAKEAGVLYVIFNLAKIFSKYVGESEKQLETVLEMIQTLAPAIVFMDEIDQSGHRRDGSGGGDSGVSQRVFQRLLQFMAETKHRGQVVFLGATNRPDLLDPAMKRAGRFDKRVPFLAPNDKQRKMIIKALCKKFGLTLKGKISDELIKYTDGYVGADLEALVNTAYELADDRSPMSKEILADDLLEARKYILPSVSKEQVEEMTRLAIADCNDLRLLPRSYGKSE